MNKVFTMIASNERTSFAKVRQNETKNHRFDSKLSLLLYFINKFHAETLIFGTTLLYLI